MSAGSRSRSRSPANRSHHQRSVKMVQFLPKNVKMYKELILHHNLWVVLKETSQSLPLPQLSIKGEGVNKNFLFQLSDLMKDLDYESDLHKIYFNYTIFSYFRPEDLLQLVLEVCNVIDLNSLLYKIIISILHLTSASR